MTVVQRCFGSFRFGGGFPPQQRGVRPGCSSEVSLEGLGVAEESLDEDVSPALDSLELGIFAEVFE